jgi:hypothetical protein
MAMSEKGRSFPIYESDESENSGTLTFSQRSDGRLPIGAIGTPAGSALKPTQFVEPNKRLQLNLFLAGEHTGVTADEAYKFAEDGLEGLSFK